MSVNEVLAAIMNLFNALGMAGFVQAMVVILLATMLLARLLNNRG